jgi:nucleotide-binding universal stress UspA family protein
VSSPAFKRVLVPIDFTEDEPEHGGEQIQLEGHSFRISDASVTALRTARQLALADKDPSSEIRLLHATPAYDHARVYRGSSGVSSLGGALDQIHAEEKETSLKVMQALGEKWCEGMKFDTSARPGTALNVILEEARDYKADLIVMPTSSRGVVARFFLGSTADRVIREAKCPVLVIPPAAGEG